MIFIEKFLEIYYRYKIIILSCLLMIFLVSAKQGFHSLNGKREDTEEPLIRNILLSLTAVCIGWIFYAAGLMPEITYPYFNGSIFLLLELPVICYGLLNYVFYKKNRTPLIQMCKYTGYVVTFELFLLAASRHLELLEGVLGILAGVLANMAAMGLEEEKTEKKEDISEETDYPNPELYPVRKRQLRKFVKVLREQKKEPYAIMIDGAWGSGKSSFVKALEKELDQDEFIWIYAGSEKTVSEILGDISDQLTAILKKNHIFVEKGGWIEKYFQAFSGMMDGFGMEVLSQVIKVPGAPSEQERRKYLNDKLRELDKNVYLVIDDLDRCSREYQEIMFKVIRESTELTNCKTLFLVDRKKFLVGDDSQIEKYISYQLELCTVDYREILNRVMDSVISDEFIERMSPVLRKGASKEELREKIYRLLEDNCNLLQSEIEKTEAELENTIKEFITAKRTEQRTAAEKLTDKKEGLEKKLIDLNVGMQELIKNTQNPRKVKRFLKDIRRIAEGLKGLERSSAEFQKADWFGMILDLLLVKNFLPELYEEIREKQNFGEFEKVYKGYTAEILLGLRLRFNEEFIFWDEKRAIMLNELVYRMDIMEFEKIQTDQEAIREELYGPYPDLGNLEKYLKNAWNIRDVEKIWDLYEKQPYEETAERAAFLKNYLEIFWRMSRGILLTSDDFYQLSEKIFRNLNSQRWSEEDRRGYEWHGRQIARMILRENSQQLKNILYAAWGVTKVDAAWKTALASVDQAGETLEELDAAGYGKLSEMPVPEKIAAYYKSLLEKMKEEESGLDIPEEEALLEKVFSLCSLWYHLGEYLDGGGKQKAAVFETYFSVQKGGSVKEKVFLNVGELKKALAVLDDFYESKKEDYQSDFSFLLLETVKRCVLCWEDDSSWFAGEASEVLNLLTKLRERVCTLDRQETGYASDVVQEISVLTARMKKYCYGQKS